MRPIDANELKEWVENWLYKDRYYHNGKVSKTIPITELYDILEQIPTTDVPDTNAEDTISRRAAIKAIEDLQDCYNGFSDTYDKACIIGVLEEVPSAQPEPLTDKEQRIFLAAMTREEKVCKEVDAEMSGEQYEEILVRVCREIVRKVKGALWT